MIRTPTTTDFVEKVRAAYLKSSAYKEIHKRNAQQSLDAALPEREPGQDDEELPLGIPRDPLEAEFEAQP